MFTVDTWNNVGRYCSIPGDTSGRNWRVVRAVAGRRYMVRHVDGAHRVVAHNSLHNLY
jgi:hypothetical protein